MIELNLIHRLSHKEFKSIQADLQKGLIDQAFAMYSKDKDFDFYHPDTFRYLNAEKVMFINKHGEYELPRAGTLGSLDIFRKLSTQKGYDFSTKDSFTESVFSSSGMFKMSDEEAYNYEVDLVDWICGEVNIGAKKYFKLDKHWYEFRSEFVEYLNRSLSNLRWDLLEFENRMPIWKDECKIEFDYNKKLESNQDTIIGDRCLYKNVEIADIIELKDGIKLYHVKRGLGRDMRILCSQINASSLIVKNAISNRDSTVFEEYYDAISKSVLYKDTGVTVRKKVGIKSVIEKKEFVSMFLDTPAEKITYVMAFSSKSKKSILDEFIESKSQIAKLHIPLYDRAVAV